MPTCFYQLPHKDLCDALHNNDGAGVYIRLPRELCHNLRMGHTWADQQQQQWGCTHSSYCDTVDGRSSVGGKLIQLVLSH